MSKQNEHDLKILTELNESYVRSVAESGVAWFDEHLSPDFLNTNPDATLVDRAAFLAQIGRPSPVRDLRCEDVRIRVFGDTAVIHARTAYSKADGQKGAGRYTDIWARQNGRWLCVAAHVTRG
ncbi:MAG: nuclear transport factor 2 family protein [Hyphomicrobiaceae bacterium]